MILACKGSPSPDDKAATEATVPQTEAAKTPAPPARAKSKRLPFSQRTPRVGDMAPDFELPRLDGDPVKLSAIRDARPTVLVFGSYT